MNHIKSTPPVGNTKPAFEPVFTQEQVKDREPYCTEQEAVRRLALAVLCKTQAELTESAEKDPDACLELLELMHDYLQYLDDIHQRVEFARARLFTVMIDVHGLEGGEVH